ncbi:MAG: phospholipid carrier-dependent glycosyltransferase [Deltaproteobacteria bacterium]|nr:phospholipid carrier-dependent glycosyltransferase [Deltaproteobacteria bacterium]
MSPPDTFSRLLFYSNICGCVLGAAATIYFVGALAGMIGNPLLNLVAAAVVSAAGLFFLYVFFVQARDKNRLGFVVWLLILLILTVEVFLGLLPPTARDELTHHLLIPRLYVQAGRIYQIPFASYSYYPMLLDMLYAPWLRWGWDAVPKLIHGLFGFLTGLLLYAYLALRLSRTYGLLGFFFFLFTPAILRLANLAYVDLGLTFYSTAALVCLLRWKEEGERPMADDGRQDPKSAIPDPKPIPGAFGWLALAGLSAGFAVATKPNGFLVLLLLSLIVLFILGGKGKKWRMKSLVSGALFLALASLPLLPWAAKNLIQTGNPFFPFFGGIFGPRGTGGSVLGVGDVELGIFARRALYFGESWWQIASLPVRIFFFGQDDRPQYFDGVLNPMLILFLPWAFRGKWLEEKKIIFGFALFYFLYALFLVEVRIRYLLPIVPPLVILLVYGLHNLYLRIVRPAFLFGGVILLLALNGMYLWRYVQTLSPVEYLKGKESREAYLTRTLSDYPAFGFINKTLPSTAKVYLLFMGRRAYYCERNYFHDSGDTAWTLVGMVRKARTETDIKAQLRETGLTHLLAREELLRRFLGSNLTAEQRELWDGFARVHLRGLFRERGYGVYEING